VKILPNHACATAAAYGHYFVTTGGTAVADVWERVSGW
jgi:D-serine deaminase-like pyridoxal phosphate-dependent protein